MPAFEVTTEVTGRASRETHVSVDSDRVTVRALIEGKVRAEIEDWRRRGLAEFGSEYRDGAWNVKSGARRRRVDEDTEVRSAIAAFEGGRFLILVGDEQVTDLDACVLVSPDIRVRFLRIVALAGG